MPQVLITARDFGEYPDLVEMFQRQGVDWTARLLPNDEAQVIEALRDMDGAVIGVQPVTERVLDACPRLKVVARIGVGFDSVDLAAASRRGVVVCTTPGANDRSVADWAFAMLLALARGLVPAHVSTAAGRWGRFTGVELPGKTLGIIGTGRIGRQVAKRAAGFDLRVLAYDVAPDPAWARSAGVEYSPFERVVREADFLTLHAPATPETENLINRETLGWMKPTAYLINTARGTLVDEQALYEALRDRRIAGAALDVFRVEPPAGSPLLGLDNVVLSPHMASATYEARHAMLKMASENALKVLRGERPAGVVNPDVYGG